VQRIHHKPMILLAKVLLISYGFYIEITLSSHENYGRATFLIIFDVPRKNEHTQ
jgi:hypothetical protein